jgi:hypothetical protein
LDVRIFHADDKIANGLASPWDGAMKDAAAAAPASFRK